jgi:hypothetical protein
MLKTMKVSPPDKKVGKKKIHCPAFVHAQNDLWHGLCDQTVEKYNRVAIVTSPFLLSKEYRDNYSDVFKHE